MVHCVLETNNSLKAEEVEDDIRKFVKERFNGLLSVSTYQAPNEICDWFVKFDNAHNFGVALKTEHQLDFIHPDNAWSLFAQLTIEDALAIKYGCKIKDEETPNQELQPHPEQHLTFHQYLETTLRFHSPMWKKALIEIELSHLPKPLRIF